MCLYVFQEVMALHLLAWWRKWCASQPGLQIYSARPLANNQATLALVLVVMMMAMMVMMMNR